MGYGTTRKHRQVLRYLLKKYYDANAVLEYICDYGGLDKLHVDLSKELEEEQGRDSRDEMWSKSIWYSNPSYPTSSMTEERKTSEQAIFEVHP